MSGVMTLLSERVESLLPHKATAAACTSLWCSQQGDRHRFCHICVSGQILCGSWMTGPC